LIKFFLFFCTFLHFTLDRTTLPPGNRKQAVWKKRQAIGLDIRQAITEYPAEPAEIVENEGGTGKRSLSGGAARKLWVGIINPGTPAGRPILYVS
jgi:hypothetical protein